MWMLIRISENTYNSVCNECMLPPDVKNVVKAIKHAQPLDKIRERIELEKLGYPPSAGYYKAIVKVLQIIDKYKGNKAESRDKEIHPVIDGDFFKGI